MNANDYLTLFISLLALVVAIVSALVGYRQQKTELRTTIRDQLTSVAQQLIAVQADMNVLNSERPENRDGIYTAKTSSLNHKLTSLARQACELDRLQPDVAFDVEFIAIANALGTSGDIPLAEKYFKKAIEKSPSSYYRVINLCLYAGFLFEQARPAEGRSAYREASSTLDHSTDFNRWANGSAYRSWFLSEVWNLPPPFGEADESYRSARNLFQSISTAGMRDTSIDELEKLRAASPLSGAPVLGELPPPGMSTQL